jgi:hypothetical protein
MVVVKGIYRGKLVELLEPIDAEDGIEVEVVFHRVKMEDVSYLKAMEQELARMDKGLSLGGGPYYRSRDELHER